MLHATQRPPVLARTAAGLLAGMVAILFSLGAVGCQSSGQTGALAGAGIGALAGQAIGGNTAGTLIGTAVGAGVGYVIGNEKDKAEAKQMSASSQSSGGQPHEHAQTGGLENTRWQLVSLAPKDAAPPYVSKIVEFQPKGVVVTTTTNHDGTVDVANEHYRVVGNTLIVNKPGYIINATFAIDRDQLIVEAEDFRAVLKRL